MKTRIKIYLILIVSIGIWIAPLKSSAQGNVSFQVFYDELSPYGSWVNISNYGYVWVPDVANGFTPYATNGYWVNTDEGWTWVSNYSWGWAPFHYGRWYTDDTYGPVWVPGNEWGPGWVTWRRSADYYGWAAMEPGVSISVAYGNTYYPTHNYWTIINNRDFGRTNINNYYVNSPSNVTIIKNSTVINNPRVGNNSNIKYNTGPDRVEVEKRVGRTFTPVAIKESIKPGQMITKNQLQIYKPVVHNNNVPGHRPAPSKVVSFKDVKTTAQRTSETHLVKPNQATRPQPVLQHRTVVPANPQPSPQQRTVQATRPQPAVQHRTIVPTKPQPSPQQRTVQPTKPQPSPEQRAVQPTKPQQPALQPTRPQPTTPPKNTGGEIHRH